MPVRHIEIMSDGEKINLGQWVNRIRVAHNGGRTYKSLTQEDIDELNDLNFMWKIKKENSFEKFYRHICDFKRDYGHINIKYGDTIHEYNIGKMYSHFFNEFKKGKLSDEQNEKLREIGIDFSIDKEANRHKNNLKLSKKAVEEGVIICVKNQIYHGVNLYNWAKKYKNRFSADEQLTIEKLLSKDVRKPTSIQDKSGKVYIYSSMREAGCALCNFFHVVDNENKGITIVYNRISGYVKSPIYKGLLIEKANA